LCLVLLRARACRSRYSHTRARAKRSKCTAKRSSALRTELAGFLREPLASTLRFHYTALMTTNKNLRPGEGYHDSRGKARTVGLPKKLCVLCCENYHPASRSACSDCGVFGDMFSPAERERVFGRNP